MHSLISICLATSLFATTPVTISTGDQEPPILLTIHGQIPLKDKKPIDWDKVATRADRINKIGGAALLVVQAVWMISNMRIPGR